MLRLGLYRYKYISTFLNYLYNQVNYLKKVRDTILFTIGTESRGLSGLHHQSLKTHFFRYVSFIHLVLSIISITITTRE